MKKDIKLGQPKREMGPEKSSRETGRNDFSFKKSNNEGREERPERREYSEKREYKPRESNKDFSFKKAGDDSRGERPERKSYSDRGDFKPKSSGKDFSFKKAGDDSRSERPERKSYSDRGDFKPKSSGKDFSFKKAGDDSRGERTERKSYSDRGDFKPKSSGKDFSFKKAGDDSRGERTERKSYSDRGDFKPKSSGRDFSFKKFDDPKNDARPERRSFSGGGEDRPKTPETNNAFKSFTKDKVNPNKAAGKKKTPNPDHVPTPKKEDGTVRLNKYLANSGVAARRKCDEYIQEGLVKVNGEVIKEMGWRLKPEDVVTFRDVQVEPKGELVYILLNKPKNYITTAEDENGRPTVLELIAGATLERVFPVGRLDKNTTGLILLTNDGDLSQKLAHPSHKLKKVYNVVLDRPIEEEDLLAIEKGLELEDGKAEVDSIYFGSDSKSAAQLTVELHIGKNRIVRRIFEHLNYKVERLDRTKFGPLVKKGIPRGAWRLLRPEEVNMLKVY